MLHLITFLLLSCRPSLSGWQWANFQVVVGVEIGSGPHWRSQRLVDVLLLEPVLEEGVGLRPEPQLDIISKLTGLTQIQMVVMGEPENWRTSKPKPSEETSNCSFSVDKTVLIVGCGWPRCKGERRCRCQCHKRHYDECKTHCRAIWRMLLLGRSCRD